MRTPLIERNTTIPTSASQIFSTAADNQTQVEINVLQGEREMAADNKSLGRFILDGIPPARRGMPQIEVTFDRFQRHSPCHCQGQTTGKEQKITIQNSTNLSEEEVEQMKKDAELHAEEDKRKKELVEARNKAKSVAFELEKQLGEYGEKVSEDTKKQLQESIDKLKELADQESATAESLDNAVNETFEIAQKMTEEVQKAGGADTQASETNEGATAEGNSKANGPANGKKPNGEVEEGEVINE